MMKKCANVPNILQIIRLSPKCSLKAIISPKYETKLNCLSKRTETVVSMLTSHVEVLRSVTQWKSWTHSHVGHVPIWRYTVSDSNVLTEFVWAITSLLLPLYIVQFVFQATVRVCNVEPSELLFFWSAGVNPSKMQHSDIFKLPSIFGSYFTSCAFEICMNRFELVHGDWRESLIGFTWTPRDLGFKEFPVNWKFSLSLLSSSLLVTEKIDWFVHFSILKDTELFLQR